MDFRVGRTGRIQPEAPNTHGTPPQLEARVLAVRPPRQRAAGPPKHVSERRGKPEQRDPRGGRVLVLMIPDANQLPPGLDRGEYRVFLRFARR